VTSQKEKEKIIPLGAGVTAAQIKIPTAPVQTPMAAAAAAAAAASLCCAPERNCGRNAPAAAAAAASDSCVLPKRYIASLSI